MYCTTDEVYEATLLTTSEVPAANVTEFIRSAEAEVDAFTHTTYWNVEDSGTATSGTSTTLVDSGQSWTTNAYADMYVWIHSGTGSGQMRQISSNNSTSVTVGSAWSTNPDSTSQYRIIYTGTDPYFNSSIDGNGARTFYLDPYPLRILEALTINSEVITTSTVYQYKDQGKITLGDDSEKTVFENQKPQLINIQYWWGVYPLSYLIKRYCIVCAAMKTLAAQIGGTHNIPSTYTLPEGSVTIGQAYVNIRETFNSLQSERNDLRKQLIVYSNFY